jgi:NADPH:quinone reductase
MKAALCHRLDGPDAITIDDIAPPETKAGHAVVRVRAAALNFFDTLVTRGRYQHKPELPFSPSGEIAGVIEAIGPDVEGFSPGDRVQAYIGVGGARELVSVPAARLVKIPGAVSDEIAAGLSITFGTAIHGLKDRGNLKVGESVAVLGASGGAGLAAVEIAKLMGARVIAGASSLEKVEICKAHGADDGIDYSKDDLKAELRRLTGGNGIDVVYDCVGGSFAEPAIRALAWQGRFLVVGFAAGDIPKIPLNLLLLKGADLRGVFWGEAVERDAAAHRANMQQVLDWVAGGRLKPRLHGVYPLSETADAIRILDRREAVGKVIIKVS